LSNILVIYYSRYYNLRASQAEHLFSFQNYADGHRCFYINIFNRSIPAYFKKIKFDLIIFSWSFVGTRFVENEFQSALSRIQIVKTFGCPKVILPQDEFSNTKALCDLINEFKISVVYSVSPQSEWRKMYKTIDFDRVRFERVLTGYLDEKVVHKISSRLLKSNDRLIDVGYRSGSAVYWGRFNLIKFSIAEIFLKVCKQNQLKSDIAFGWQNFLMGENWYNFLLSCKYIPGVEGGSSILDWDGQLVKSVRNYLVKHPDADFDEIEKNCIPFDKDGEIKVVALSPRHLEACLTKTCQVLIEGEYNGILVAGKHYIPLNKDFSNIDEVIKLIKADTLRKKITNQAYNDIVLSEKYTYRNFANYIITDGIGHHSAILQVQNKRKEHLTYLRNKMMDVVSWQIVRIFSFGRDIRDLIIK